MSLKTLCSTTTRTEINHRRAVREKAIEVNDLRECLAGRREREIERVLAPRSYELRLN